MRNLELLLNDNRGVYIPQHFVEEFDLDKFEGIDPEDVETLKKGPEEEWYWEAWENVLNNATYTESGKTWTLHQDGDLWLVCAKELSREEYRDFFGEDKPLMNDNVLEGFVCPVCDSEERFFISARAMFEVTDAGVLDHRDVEWNDDDWCQCDICGKTGVVSDFKVG